MNNNNNFSRPQQSVATQSFLSTVDVNIQVNICLCKFESYKNLYPELDLY